MSKWWFLFLSIAVVFLASCEIRAQIRNEPSQQELTVEERTLLSSELLSLSEVFSNLDGFYRFSFARYKWRAEQTMVVRVTFDRDIYLGVREFEIESSNIKDLKLKTKQLAEEIKDAQNRPGS